MSASERLPVEGGGERIVCHVDIDCFYAACERLQEPALCGEPVVVGMGYKPGTTDGAVATASYEARAFGVESAQAISTALERLPRKIDAAQDPALSVDEAGFYRPVDMAFYESVSQDVQAILRERADVFREVSIDEAYLDLSERLDWAEAEAFGRALKREIHAEVGVTASVGIAPTMSGAKVASDRDKPDGLVVVQPGDVTEFLAPLNTEAIHGVGPVTARELRGMDIETAGDLAAADPAILRERFGERGRRIYRFARGDDERDVTPRGKPKSLSRESAFGEATDSSRRHRERIRQLAQDVATRAKRREVLYRTVGIKVVTPPFDVHNRAQTLPGPVEDWDLLESTALALLEDLVGQPIRKLGVSISNLSFTDGTQPTLADWSENVGGETGGEQNGVNPSSELDTPPGQQSLWEYD